MAAPNTPDGITSLYVHPGTLNVGIGTSNPRAKLEVAGNILPSSNMAYDIGSANLRFRDIYLSGNTIDLGGTAITRDANTGGIKVSDPASGGAPLDLTVKNLVASNVSVIGDFVTLNTVTSNTEQVVITNAGTGPALKVTQTGTEAIAEFYDDGGVLALKVADGGNVGIGTSFPRASLSIWGNGQSSSTSFNTSTIGGSLQICDLNSVPNSGGAVVFGTRQGNFATIKSMITNGDNNTTGHIGFFTRNATTDTTLTNRMTILDNGNVGIGTNDPSQKLVVSGNADVTNQLRTKDMCAFPGSSDGPVRFFSVQSGTGWNHSSLQVCELNLEGAGTGVASSAPSLAFHWRARAASQIRLESSGRLAVMNNPGTTYEAFASGAQSISAGNSSMTTYGPNTTWSSYLAVGAGDSVISSNKAQCISTNGNLHLDSATGKSIYANYYSNGTVLKPGGGSWGDSSDERLKYEINDIQNALETLTKLRGVQFKWKYPEHHQNKNTMQHGFIAQEYADVFPQSISHTPAINDDEKELCPDGIKVLSINADFHAFTVEALRELYLDHVKRLEDENKHFKCEIDLLKKRLDNAGFY